MQARCDIAIIGSGIVGMVAARCFAACGLSVRLFDKAAKPAHKASLALPLSLRSRSVALLQRLDFDVESIPHQVIQRLNLSSLGRFGIADLQASPEPNLAIVVEGLELANKMADRIAADPHIALTIASVESITGDEQQGFIVQAEGQQWHAARCVIADGANSHLSKQFPGKLEVLPKPMQSTIMSVCADDWDAAQAWIRQDGDCVYGAIPWHKGQGWVIATAPHRMLKKDESPDRDLWEARMNHVFASRLGILSIQAQPLQRLSMLQRNTLHALDGVIRLGNAALQVPPIGAQGLNIALQDCEDLLALQQAYPWQRHTAAIWQAQLSASCQRRHDYAYAQMALALQQLLDKGVLAQWVNHAAWLLLGCNHGMQQKVQHVGQGYY